MTNTITKTIRNFSDKNAAVFGKYLHNDLRYTSEMSPIHKSFCHCC